MVQKNKNPWETKDFYFDKNSYNTKLILLMKKIISNNYNKFD